MRVATVRVSGFRSIPAGVTIEAVPGQRSRADARRLHLNWGCESFCVQLPVEQTANRPLLSAIMGANSTGKSTLLHALDCFFGPAVKLDAHQFHAKQVEQPIVIEVTLIGRLAAPDGWQQANCAPVDEDAQHGNGGVWTHTVASIWRGEQRQRYTRLADGRYIRQGVRDRAASEALMPAWRVIWADRLPQQETQLERNSLLRDLLDGLVEEAGAESAIGQMGQLLDELATLANHRSSSASWQEVSHLEQKLAAGLGVVASRPPDVRLQVAAGVPSLRQVLAQSLLQIDDGVALDLAQQGLGMQRALVVSILHAWCELVRRRRQDYLFAIEEPEIYLHPHATRVLLGSLERIAQTDQVLFTTHAGEFVNRTPLEQIVMMRRDGRPGATRAVQPRLDGLSQRDLIKVQRYLQEDRSDMLFARAVILVEGQAEYFALPAFARTLGLDLDAAGISVVFVNGIGNFATYHSLLATLEIPHVVMMDGDGQQQRRAREAAGLADVVLVLPQDFEHMLVQALDTGRLRYLIQECRARQGRTGREGPGATRKRAQALAALGKPLVGRVAGELLTAAEIRRMPEVVQALDAALTMATAEANTDQVVDETGDEHTDEHGAGP